MTELYKLLSIIYATGLYTDRLTSTVYNNKHFIIPRIAGIENNYVELGIGLLQNQINLNSIYIYLFLINKIQI